MKKRNTILGFGFVIVLFFSCSHPDNYQKPLPWNPDGKSEMSVLMREMQVDMQRMKMELEQGKVTKPQLDYSKIATAELTHPKQKSNVFYSTFSEILIQDYQELLNNKSEKQELLYERMYNTCRNCHMKVCPVPLRLIDELELKWR